MILYFDGGCTPNPGAMEVSVVLDGKVRHQHNIGFGTNNQAEWLSLLWGMSLAINEGTDRLVVFGDSSLVVNQANENWRCRDEMLQSYLAEFRVLKKLFRSVDIHYVKREENLAGIVIEEAKRRR